MGQKASTPWSVRTVAEGGTDSPVGDLVPVPDKITPVVSTGFIALSGKYTGLPADDLAFTITNVDEALGPGASMFATPINMLNHNQLLLAILDSSGNGINVDIFYRNPDTLIGPYTIFQDVGTEGGAGWKSSEPGDGAGTFSDILADTTEDLSNLWRFYKIGYMKGTLGTILIRSNEGADAGIISVATLRLI